jgi:hypothetical protein
MRTQFEELMHEVMADADRFGHRQHVHLTWLAVRRHGKHAAVDLVSEGIRETASTRAARRSTTPRSAGRGSSSSRTTSTRCPTRPSTPTWPTVRGSWTRGC